VIYISKRWLVSQSN